MPILWAFLDFVNHSERLIMDNFLYRVKAIPATDKKPFQFKVTRVLTGVTRTAPLDYSAPLPLAQAVLTAFGDGWETINLEYCGADKQGAYYISNPV